MFWADIRMRQCYLVRFAWMANYFENIHFDWIKQPHGPLCEATKLLFGEGNSSSWQLKHYQLYFQKMILPTQEDKMERRVASQYLECRVVGISEGVFWIVLAMGPNSRVGSGSSSTQNRTVATGLTTRKTQPIGNGPVLPPKTRFSTSQPCLQSSIWVLIVSWHNQYLDCAVLAALSPPDLRCVIGPIFVESQSKTR